MSYELSAKRGSLRQVRRLHRPHPQGREAPDLPMAAGDEVRTGDERPDYQDPGHHGPPVASSPRRRGDRISPCDGAILLSAPAIRPFSTTSMCRRRSRKPARCWSRPTPSASAGRNCWCDRASTNGCRRCRRSPASRWPARWPRSASGRRLSARTKGLCQRARAAATRRMLRRIHRGAGTGAAHLASARRPRSGGVPFELPGRLASAAHRDARRTGRDGADRCGIRRIGQRGDTACDARRHDGDRPRRHRREGPGAESFGADHVIDYRSEDVAARVAGSPAARASTWSSMRPAARA